MEEDRRTPSTEHTPDLRGVTGDPGPVGPGMTAAPRGSGDVDPDALRYKEADFEQAGGGH